MCPNMAASAKAEAKTADPATPRCMAVWREHDEALLNTTVLLQQQKQKQQQQVHTTHNTNVLQLQDAGLETISWPPMAAGCC